ncbi:MULTISPECIES: LamG-like jellyroll fold domain-containing protein [unclassified Mesorhizobium]|uniref:LamG-like jellyroll fold domain-containing protein n=1 Tax=unclassified Mesorhizobium TaxID=325217 RepID=UPI00112AAB14|nr:MULTISPECIES: LamG-like jellyroll fold domain-containing protein [unclassified Mesorhizobium]TPL00244.1 LamG domain-containing protein [Mesorhizobium sp. B2-4-16]TPL66316.1 LamG domain-containing protein [Mesorhizobium sp. B2-4-3]
MYPGIIPRITQQPVKKATLLLHFEGANSSQVFIDDSLNNLTIAAAGNAQIDTSTFVFGASCGTFDGTGDYLYTDDPRAFVGTGDFTIEGRVCCTNEASAGRPLFDTRAVTGGLGMYLSLNSSESLVLSTSTTAAGNDKVRQASSSLTVGTWYSWAVCRVSGTWRCFLNGATFGSSFSDTQVFPTQAVTIGAFIDTRDSSGPNNKFKGNLDEFRISNIARYTANYTPAGSAFSRYD